MMRKIVIIVLIVVAVLLSACNLLTNVSFFVSGTIISQIDYSNIKIFVNGKERVETVDGEGNFSITELNDGDVVSFYLKGYDIDDVNVDGVSLTGVMITARPKRYGVSVAYDDTLGSVEGCGEYDFGTEAELTFLPNEHVVFNGLYNGANLIGTSGGKYRFTVDGDVDFTAVFSKILYPITLTLNYIDAPATVTSSVAFGGDVTLDAKDDEKYVFVKWIVDGAEISDKHYVFALNDVSKTVEAVFVKRLATPDLTADGSLISWQSIVGAVSYDVYVDGVFALNSGETQIDINRFSPFTGEHIVEVAAKGNGGDSQRGKVKVNYVRRLDSPKVNGVVKNGESVLFSFVKVLAADGYAIFVNGQRYNLNSLSYEERGSDVLVNVTPLLGTPGEYTFRVAALGDAPANDSLSSDASVFVYTPQLGFPEVTLTDGLLKWLHTDSGVTFDVVVNGVAVLSGVGNGETDISTLVEGDGAEVTVVAAKDGYASSKITINYKR